MSLLANPLALRAGLLLFGAMVVFGFSLFLMRQLRKNLVSESFSFDSAPLATEGLPVHAYHSVIQQLKQQKQELAAQHLSERRKAKASDTLSSAILANLSCGVLFLNNNGMVRQANAAARELLGFASPASARKCLVSRSPLDCAMTGPERMRRSPARLRAPHPAAERHWFSPYAGRLFWGRFGRSSDGER